MQETGAYFPHLGVHWWLFLSRATKKGSICLTREHTPFVEANVDMAPVFQHFKQNISLARKL